MSEEKVEVLEKVKERKNIYSNADKNLKREIYLKINEESGMWEDAEKSEKGKEGVKTEELEFIKPWWTLSVKVDSFSTKLNELGLRMQDPTIAVEMTIRYYLKKCSFYELKFEKDDEGFERISDDQWEEMSGRDGIPPEVILAMFRTYREVSEV